MNKIQFNGIDVVSAKEIHKELGISKAFSTWFETNSTRAMLEINKDFFPFREESTWGRPSINYLLACNCLRFK